MERGKGKQGEGKRGKVDGEEQRFPLSSSSSNFYDFFPRAIAPFTGNISSYVFLSSSQPEIKFRRSFKNQGHIHDSISPVGVGRGIDAS